MSIEKPFDANMPLVEMTKEQLRATFDSMMTQPNLKHMNGVRKGLDQEVLIAVGFLLMKGGTRRVITSDCEYGDGEGIRFVDEHLEELERTGQIRKGETVDRKVFKCILPDYTSDI